MRCLVIGDPHLKVSNLEDAKSFIDQTIEIIDKDCPDQVTLLGDLFNDFAVVRSEVLKVWTDFFLRASKLSKIVCLVGNHDMAGADGGTFPMEPFKAIPNVTIVDSPMFIGGIFYMPFLRDNSEFAAYLSGVPKGHVVFCHQSFNGATFDNGFFDPHGADPKCAEHLGAVICGHIHKKQILGNIYYPGTPFQHSFGEAGQEKSIVMLDLRSKGYSILKEYQLLMPKFYEIKTENLEDLKNKIESILKADLSRSNIKVISQASPSEIAQFWQDPIIKEFRAKARRVVDALTSTKPLNKLSLTKGTTRKEQLDEYIKAKEWRTSADRILSRAREYLTL